MIITTEEAKHGAAIERLLDVAFGSDRFQKSSYRLRENVLPVNDLCLVAVEHDDIGRARLLGTIRYWEVMAGNVRALLLGPIAVLPELQGSGLGSKLIRMSLNKAAAAGYRAVLLVGDAPYYERFGFSRALTLGLAMPGPTDPNRFLGLELQDGALSKAVGMVSRIAGESSFGSATSGIDTGFADVLMDNPIWYSRLN